MANYTTSTSDKSKKSAMIRLVCGFVGLHLFYVGRIKAGLIRLIFGLLVWSLIITGIKDGDAAIAIAGVVFLIAVNVPDLIKLALGTFKDNVGNVLRA